jgi:hypothetical protein
MPVFREAARARVHVLVHSSIIAPDAGALMGRWVSWFLQA